MIYIDWEQLQETLTAGGRDGVCRMVCIRPGVCSVRKSPVREQVKNPFVRILSRTHENQTGKIVSKHHPDEVTHTVRGYEGIPSRRKLDI